MFNQMPIDIQEHIWKTYYNTQVIEEFRKVSKNAKFHQYLSYLPISVRYDWMKKTYRDDIIYC
jgi:hypothetical protein